MGVIAVRIIDPHQLGFVKGRHITDLIVFVSEFMDLLSRRCQIIDPHQLGWDFLVVVLRSFGFSDRFCDRNLTKLGSVRISILLNGLPQGYFACTRRVRLCDPISPLLFCLAKEFLNRLLF